MKPIEVKETPNESLSLSGPTMPIKTVRRLRCSKGHEFDAVLGIDLGYALFFSSVSFQLEDGTMSKQKCGVCFRDWFLANMGDVEDVTDAPSHDYREPTDVPGEGAT